MVSTGGERVDFIDDVPDALGGIISVFVLWCPCIPTRPWTLKDSKISRADRSVDKGSLLELR